MKLLSLLAACVVLSSTAAADIVYVDGSTTQDIDPLHIEDGFTWNTAYRDLQQGLNHANHSAGRDTVIVSEGIYTPRGPGQWAQFVVYDETTVIGGYQVGNQWDNPTGDKYGTILSGEIGTLSHADNCYNIVTIYQLAATVSLQRLKIQGGHGGAYAFQVGFCGGGIFFDRFNDHLNHGVTNITFSDIWIDNCFAHMHGGGMYYAARPAMTTVGDSSLHISGFRVSNCWAGNQTGGVSIILQEEYNDAKYDGIIHDLNIYNCGAENNVGGLAILANRTEIEIVNSQIHDCVVSGYYAAFAASTSSLSSHAAIDFKFCTFYNNRGINHHTGFIATSLYSDISFTSSILWHNQAFGDNMFIHNQGAVTMDYCCIQQGLPLNIAGSNNLTVDPVLNTQLIPELLSPILNKAARCNYPVDTFDIDHDLDTEEDVPYDIEGLPRYVLLIPDIGAHERQ